MHLLRRNPSVLLRSFYSLRKPAPFTQRSLYCGIFLIITCASRVSRRQRNPICCGYPSVTLRVPPPLKQSVKGGKGSPEVNGGVSICEGNSNAVRVEHCISPNSGHPLFGQCEMSKRIVKGVCGARARRFIFRAPRETLVPQTHEIFRSRPKRKICEPYCIFSCLTFLSTTWREASCAFTSFGVMPYSAMSTKIW